MSADLRAILEATLRLATPLLFAALGGLVSERAGIVALGLEGMMIGSAFAAGAVAALTGSAWLGLAAAVLAGAIIASLYGCASIGGRGGQIALSMAINLLLGGLCPAMALGWFERGGDTPTLTNTARLLPIVGGIGIMPVLAAVSVPLTAVLLARTRLGLHLTAAGENPDALGAAGLSVSKTRYMALAYCGAFAGLGAADLVLADGTGFTRNLIAGRGFIALAALIFGRWQPWPTALVCVLFAAADALQIRYQAVPLPLIGAIPVAFVQAFPALLTVLLLAFLASRGQMPSALGRPFPMDVEP